MNETIKYEQTLTEVLSQSRKHSFGSNSKNITLRHFGMIILLFAAIAYDKVYTPVIIYATLAFIAMVLISFLLRHIRLRRSLYALFEGKSLIPVELHFYEEGLSYKIGKHQVKILWGEINEVEEVEELIILSSYSGRATIRKRYLSRELSEFIETKTDFPTLLPI